jgi:hypothetical protein
MHKLLLTIALATGLLGCAGAGEGTPDDTLNTKLINLGDYALTSFYCQPAASMPEVDWEGADWGANLLPVARLDNLEFVVIQSLARINADCMASFDNAGQVLYRRNNGVRADWMDEPALTVYFSINDMSEGAGYGWGVEEIPGQVDVTP